MFDLPMNPMMLATMAADGVSLQRPAYVEVANAADLDVGYEVAFPFLTAADDSDS